MHASGKDVWSCFLSHFPGKVRCQQTPRFQNLVSNCPTLAEQWAQRQAFSQKLDTFLDPKALLWGMDGRVSRVKMGTGENWPEVGCEIGWVRNIGIVVRGMKMGEWVSGGM